MFIYKWESVVNEIEWYHQLVSEDHGSAPEFEIIFMIYTRLNNV